MFTLTWVYTASIIANVKHYIVILFDLPLSYISRSIDLVFLRRSWSLSAPVIATSVKPCIVILLDTFKHPL